MIEAELDAGNRPLVDALYVTTAIDTLRAKGKTPQDAATELQTALVGTLCVFCSRQTTLRTQTL